MPATMVKTSSSSRTIAEDSRPRKKLKVQGMKSDSAAAVDWSSAAILQHPLGVKPAGNAYTASTNSKANAGLFAKLPDELVMHFLECLKVQELLSLSQCCKYLCAFCYTDELWRALFIESPPKKFVWRSSWRSTFLCLDGSQTSQIQCDSVFSDVLHRPFFCAHTSLKPYAANIPRANSITRLGNLTQEEYFSKWSNQPFILTSPVKEWPIYGEWSTDSLLRNYGQVAFRAESVDWPLQTYISYMNNQQDESPLYLFDCSFVEKMGLKVGRGVQGASYWPPDCFGEDLFNVLGHDRPDRRWLIIGPERSGSTFHKDPNSTSAWNAVLTGSKYWLMFPSGSNILPPPGVILSDDASEITSPLSIAEYLLNFHEVARATPGCKEGVCHAGEVLHVPSGWFHLVLNLKDSIALTQNFVPRHRLVHVLRFLRDCPDQVSGFKDDITDPYGLFVERLREKHPGPLQEALDKLVGSYGCGRTRWEVLTKGYGESQESNGFTFGFGGDDNEDIP